MNLIDGKKIVNELLEELSERNKARDIWEQQVKMGVLTYADIEYANGYDQALEKVCNKINEGHHIEAIPVEWIKSKKTEITHEKYDYVRGCQEGFNDCIDMLIEDWEKENE